MFSEQISNAVGNLFPGTKFIINNRSRLLMVIECLRLEKTLIMKPHDDILEFGHRYSRFNLFVALI